VYLFILLSPSHPPSLPPIAHFFLIYSFSLLLPSVSFSSNSTHSILFLRFPNLPRSQLHCGVSNVYNGWVASIDYFKYDRKCWGLYCAIFLNRYNYLPMGNYVLQVNLENTEHILIPNLSVEIKFCYVRFEVFTAVTMKNGVFWVVSPCGSCKNRRLGGTWRLLHQGDKNRWTRNNTSCN
jgi:hypothetical protein